MVTVTPSAYIAYDINAQAQHIGMMPSFTSMTDICLCPYAVDTWLDFSAQGTFAYFVMLVNRRSICT